MYSNQSMWFYTYGSSIDGLKCILCTLSSNKEIKSAYVHKSLWIAIEADDSVIKFIRATWGKGAFQNGRRSYSTLCCFSLFYLIYMY